MNKLQQALPIWTAIILCGASGSPGASAETQSLRRQATDALRRAVTYYRTKLASHGGYVYYYSIDLERRWGEGEATRHQIWVQPPGTPTVGMAYVRAYEATRDTAYLDAAREAAEALVYGQLESGGWTNCIDFDPRGRRVARYRNGKGRGKNNSTLDDGISQAAIRLLMHVDEALGFRHEGIHGAVELALRALLAAQFPNGAFPQVWTGPVSRHPIRKASFPTYDWRTEGRIKNYWDMYTLNDGVAGSVAETLIDAHDIYKVERYKEALARLGEFLILAQMPEPQPAWAQQYSYDMHPIWARRFEPPGISGWESQDVLETLLKIYRSTGNKKLLAPVPPALRYLERSLLSDGRLARYYELRSNRPLYMNRRGKVYELTYDDSKLPRHYGWKMPARLKEIGAEYEALRRHGPGWREKRSVPDLAERIRAILRDLDGQGRWISTATGRRLVGQPRFAPDTRYISSAVFSRNIEALSEYLLATK